MDTIWYIKDESAAESKGPFASRDIFVMLETNEITSHTQVRTESCEKSDSNWRQIIEVEELRTQIINDRHEALERIENFFAPNSTMDTAPAIAGGKESSESEDGTEGLGGITEDGLVDMVDLKLKKKIAKEAKDILNKKTDKLQGLTEDQINRKKAQRQREKRKNKWYDAKINTNIYITEIFLMTQGLPSEIDPIYLKEFFLKAGVVRLNHVTGEEKIKLYKNDDGTLKGDALVSYAKEESVAIAIEMLSERDIIPGHKITITKAEFQQRGDDYKKRAVQVVDPIAKIRYQVNQEKMLTWDDDIQGEGLRIVIVKNMFTPEIVLTDPEYLEMIREDITCECEQNAWKVKRMVIFEFHPEGVVEIKFEKGEHAEACIGVFNGRFYGGRMLECGYYDGKTNYKNLRESKEDEQKRIDEFGDWLGEKFDKDELFEDIDKMIDNIDIENLDLEALEELGREG